ncbi:hypothetical protein AAFN60_05320 [Roseibacillus persicicus]|uniref:hypothetical protein n=1 Tax=Roseibacillus persicicus TaxID=454148 RepID=UPI00398AD32A
MVNAHVPLSSLFEECDPVTTSLSALQTSSDQIVSKTFTNLEETATWTHHVAGAAGFNLGLACLEIRTFTQTDGTSLIFGREQKARTALGVDLSALIEGILEIDLMSNWESDLTLDTDLLEGGNYVLRCTVIPDNSLIDISGLLANTQVSIAGSVTDTNGVGGVNVHLLDLVDISLLAESEALDIEIPFQATEDSSTIDINFDSDGLVNLGVLNSVSAPGGNGTQAVLKFADLAVISVNEPLEDLILSIEQSSEDSVELSWTGGSGVIDIEVSTDLNQWDTFEVNASSPITVPIVFNEDPKRFFRAVKR